MRFIYKMLLGMIIFTGMLVYLEDTFSIQGIPPQAGSNAQNVSDDANYTDYKISGNPLSITGSSITIIGIFVSIGFLISFAIKSPIPIGAMLVAGVVANLYYQSNTIVKSVIPGDMYWVIVGIIDIVLICIAIILAFTVAEIFSGQAGADN